MQYKGIFFDLYGTLLIFGDMKAAWENWMTAYYNIIVERGFNISEENFIAQLDGFFSRLRPAVINPELTVYEHRLLEQNKKIGFNSSIPMLHKMANVTINAWDNYVQIDPEAIDVLSKLKNLFKLALITNFDHPPHIHDLLARHKLKNLFEEIIISGEVGSDKPDPKIFQTALDKTNLKPAEVVFIGDSPEDVNGSKNAGLKPVLIKRERDENDHIYLDYYSDIKNHNFVREAVDEDGVHIISKLSELLTIFGVK
ncbi:MAG: hypothetical protein A2V66_04145 [Ignavibacteria bacterium RBG_13_36_8]|nr:MAG: hypothetical protein A2V66_04145 [Ignavibacteria bacterium RBG_13_36_8]